MLTENILEREDGVITFALLLKLFLFSKKEKRFYMDEIPQKL